MSKRKRSFWTKIKINILWNSYKLMFGEIAGGDPWYFDFMNIMVNDWSGSLFYIGYIEKEWEIDILFTRQLIYTLKDRWDDRRHGFK